MNSLEVFTDMTNSEYHGRKSHISRSVAHRYSGMYGGRAQRFEEVEGGTIFEGSTAVSFGTLVDVAFEAEAGGVDWRSRCTTPPSSVLATDGSRRGTAFTEWRSSLPEGMIECTSSDHSRVGHILASIKEHREAKKLLDSITHTQYSVFWLDEDVHARKARADGVSKTAWFDLKTTSSSWSKIKYSFRDYGYDWQSAWYTDAAKAAGWGDFIFQFIAVQVTAPFDVAVISLTDDSVERARQDIRRTLSDMRRRRDSGDYVDASYHDAQVLDLG